MFFEIRNGCGFQGALLKMASDSEGLRQNTSALTICMLYPVEKGFQHRIGQLLAIEFIGE